MFTVTKVKLHGMRDERWTTKDKLHQYRGLMKLYNRDRKIMNLDKQNATRKRVKDLKSLHKQIAIKRENLDNAIRSDRLKIRNTLAVNRSLQLAYQNLHSTKIIDQIYQENFSKRKELDRIFYRQKMKTKKLIQLKLELAELEDRTTHEGPGKIQVEIDAGVITGKVQQAILKKEAAITVQQTYINIINIMKQDRIYYEAILNSLKEECVAQGICLFHTIQMGQLATEYLDNRRQDYENMEMQVRINMRKRIKHLHEVNEQVEKMTSNVKNLVRRESDNDLIKLQNGFPTNEHQLQHEIDVTTELLDKLRSITAVTSFDAIYPCMVAQRKQCERLGELFARNTQDHDRLLNKENHAKLMLDQISLTMVETTMDYKREKGELLKQIQEQKNRRTVLIDMVRMRSELTVNIRKSLQQLHTITNPVTIGDIKRHDQVKGAKFETDAIKLIEILARRFYVLAEAPVLKLNNKERQKADTLFEKLVQCHVGDQFEQTDLDDSDLVDGLEFEDPQIPTREYIKRKSKELVDHNVKLQLIEANTATTEKSLKAYKKAQSKKRAMKG